jgi:hypothetical protein
MPRRRSATRRPEGLTASKWLLVEDGELEGVVVMAVLISPEVLRHIGFAEAVCR